MDGLPSFDQAVKGGSLTQDVANLAPLATSWHGAQNGVPIAQTLPRASSQGVLPAFWGKVESVASEGAHILGGVGSFIGHNIADMATPPLKLGSSLGHLALDSFNVNTNAKQSQELGNRLDSITQMYKSGQMSSKEYKMALGEWNMDNNNLLKSIESTDSNISSDKNNVIKTSIDTAGTVATIMTLGIASPEIVAGTKAATDLLTSASQLDHGAQIISKLASSEADWKSLTPLVQNAVRVSTAQVLAAAGKSATAEQITKAVASNILLKYPLTYNVLSSTGQQVYNELNQNKYGDAIKTIAFNAALLLSGGPIGWGIKNATKAVDSAYVAAGLRPGSMLDELSAKFAGNDSRALAKIAQEELAKGNEADVKAMIVGLDSNLKAAGNNGRAVGQIVNHLENYIGWGSLENMTPRQGWDNIVNYWKHAEGLQTLKTEGQIAGIAKDDPRAIVPGRFSTGDKNAIATASKDGLPGWEAYKAANPNSAAANNPNVERQVSEIIKRVKDPEERAREINRIPTQIGLEGVPKDYAAKMAKDGYIAIIPKSHNLPVVPFAETSGKLATKGLEGDYFVSAAQPVPVLQHLGAFLTNAGLSPEVAQQRVNDVFRQNLDAELARLDFQHFAGEKGAVYDRLSNYAKAPTVGRVMVNGAPLRTPIVDLRQLTTKDVMAALSVTKSQAKDVQEAILQAYLEVPRSITGLGNKILDYNFKLNPLAAPYSRVQGAFRFAWNPVFRQGKLPMKAEFLAQMQTGGKFPTVAGTNTFMRLFFPGQYKELDSIVNNPGFRALLPGGLGGEAADLTGNTIAHADHYPKNALLPVAGVIKDMAAKTGLDTETFIKQFPSQVQDATTAILHYDRNANFLNSPMARTLNMAFFPFRFNVKVAGFMARALAKQEPIVQYAVVKGMMNAGDFLKSPQGQAWYSQNADVIGLFKYFSPVETLSVISNALDGSHDGVAQYGELGGLPFGWIPQLLDSVGLTHFGQPYVNPKTGVIAKDYVPTSAYGALNAAINDLLGSLFTYPGATVGLPSKGTIDRTIVGGILPNSSKDFSSSTPALSPELQSFQQAVQQTNGTAPPTPQAPVNPQAIKVPAQSTPLTVPKTKPSRASSSPKKKKNDYRPSLLPGQSSLGQL